MPASFLFRLPQLKSNWSYGSSALANNDMVEVAGNHKRLIIVLVEMDVILEQKLAVNILSARFSQNDKAPLAVQ